MLYINILKQREEIYAWQQKDSKENVSYIFFWSSLFISVHDSRFNYNQEIFIDLPCTEIALGGLHDIIVFFLFLLFLFVLPLDIYRLGGTSNSLYNSKIKEFIF